MRTRADKRLHSALLLDVTLALASLVAAILTPEERVRNQNDQVHRLVIFRYRNVK